MMQGMDLPELGLLLLVACCVAIGSARVRLPYAVGLVAAGLALGLAGFPGRAALTGHLLFGAILPPLIFEAALHLGWGRFRREAPLVLSLAFIGTALSAAVVAGLMHGLAGWGWPAALLFGALIAATDPVSVIAMMKEQQAEPRLRFLMEAESIVNDGAAAVLFALVAGVIEGQAASPSAMALALATTVGGGVLAGLAVGAALMLMAGRASDPLVEIALTLLAAYGAFWLADGLHVSGVLATLAAGMLVGNWGKGRHLSAAGGQAALAFWEFAAFLANSLVFLLIGSREAAQPITAYLWPAAMGTLAVLAGRAAAIYPLGALFARSRLAMDRLTQHILFWGGLRGALAIALALEAPASLPEHAALVSTAFAVVAFSIFVQGLSVPRLLARA
ncbi:MAG TPA: sodium:proton antiporter [Novosphingobium sp.]|nr:sodium:proton antiporter [Novosphingobium sp.]